MKRMQKLLSCVLLLGLLASCLSGVCFANGKTQADAGTHKAMADNTPAETAEMQQAVVELAAAYLRATANTRYDTDVMTAMTRLNGVEHVSTHDVVGTIAPDNIYLSNCSQFGYALYYETFGRGPLDVNGHYAVVNNYINNSVAGDPEVVLLLDKGADNAGRAEFVRQAKELLQPGDVVNSRFHGEEKSHTMVYVGDYKGDGGHWTIHSSGGQPGHLGAAGKPTIKVSDWDVFLGNGLFGAMRDTMQISILRPINVMDYDMLSDAGKSRVKFSGLDLMRQGDVWQYMDVQNGQEITVTQTVKNSGKTAYSGLTIADPAPEGGEIVAGSVSHSGTVKDGGVFWTLNLAAGEEVKLTYKVKVTAQNGGAVKLAAGKADGTIPTRDLVWYVGGKPVDEAPFKALQTNPVVEGMTENTNTMELDFANVFYKNVLGIDLGLTKSLQTVLDGMMDTIKVVGADAIANGKMLQPKPYSEMTPEAQKVFNMTLPDHLVGFAVNVGTDPLTMRPPNRIKIYHKEAYRPGDIFVMLNGPFARKVRSAEKVEVAIYLGDGKVLMSKIDGTGLEVRNFADTVEKTFETNVMFTLRPSCTFPDTLTDYLYPPEVPETLETPEAPGTPESPETPETPAAAGGSSRTVLLIGIVAAGAILGVVMGIVLKKKQK